MEKIEISINPNYHHILIFASTDKKLNSNEFRVLFYICTNIENIYIEEVKTKLNIKTNNSISEYIKTLIENKYIKRIRNKKLIKKGVPFYSYIVTTEKPLLPNNNNSFLSDNYFKSIDEIFEYFFKIIPVTKKIDISSNRKQIELLIFKDDYSIEIIKKVIDYISISKYRFLINSPILLRKKFKEIYQEFKLSIKSN